MRTIRKFSTYLIVSWLPQGVNVQLCYWGLRSFTVIFLFSIIAKCSESGGNGIIIEMPGRFPPTALFAVLSLTVRISLSYWNSFSFILHPAIEPVMRNVSNSHHFRLSFFFTKTVLMRKLIMLKSGLLLGGVIKCQSLKSSCTWILATQMFYAAWHHRSA